METCNILTLCLVVLCVLVSRTFADRKICGHYADCDDENDPINSFCCAYGCCSEEEFQSQICVYNFNCPKPGMNSSKAYCCRHGCCEKEQYYSNACTKHSDCPVNSTETFSLETFCCKSGCCDAHHYNITTGCRSHVDCPGRSYDKEMEFCCGTKCCLLEEFDPNAKLCHDDEDCSDVKMECCDGKCCSSSEVPTGAIVGILIAILVIIAITIFIIYKMQQKKHGKNYKAGIASKGSQQATKVNEDSTNVEMQPMQNDEPKSTI